MTPRERNTLLGCFAIVLLWLLVFATAWAMTTGAVQRVADWLYTPLGFSVAFATITIGGFVGLMAQNERRNR